MRVDAQNCQKRKHCPCGNLTPKYFVNMVCDSVLYGITCSMLTIETLRRTYKIFMKLTIKTAETVCEYRISTSDTKNVAFPRGVTQLSGISRGEAFFCPEFPRAK